MLQRRSGRGIIKHQTHDILDDAFNPKKINLSKSQLTGPEIAATTFVGGNIVGFAVAGFGISAIVILIVLFLAFFYVSRHYLKNSAAYMKKNDGDIESGLGGSSYRHRETPGGTLSQVTPGGPDDDSHITPGGPPATKLQPAPTALQPLHTPSWKKRTQVAAGGVQLEEAERKEQEKPMVEIDIQGENSGNYYSSADDSSSGWGSGRAKSVLQRSQSLQMTKSSEPGHSAARPMSRLLAPNAFNGPLAMKAWRDKILLRMKHLEKLEAMEAEAEAEAMEVVVPRQSVKEMAVAELGGSAQMAHWRRQIEVRMQYIKSHPMGQEEEESEESIPRQSVKEMAVAELGGSAQMAHWRRQIEIRMQYIKSHPMGQEEEELEESRQSIKENAVTELGGTDNAFNGPLAMKAWRDKILHRMEHLKKLEAMEAKAEVEVLKTGVPRQSVKEMAIAELGGPAQIAHWRRQIEIRMQYIKSHPMGQEEEEESEESEKSLKERAVSPSDSLLELKEQEAGVSEWRTKLFQRIANEERVETNEHLFSMTPN